MTRGVAIRADRVFLRHRARTVPPCPSSSTATDDSRELNRLAA